VVFLLAAWMWQNPLGSLKTQRVLDGEAGREATKLEAA
jgi:hypothetical protein